MKPVSVYYHYLKKLLIFRSFLIDEIDNKENEIDNEIISTDILKISMMILK